MNTMGAALQTQFRVVLALVLREMRVKYGKSQLGYIWALVEPLMYIVVMSVLFSYIGRTASFGNSFALFFATGVLPFKLWQVISRDLLVVLDANATLLTYPVVKEIDAIFARFLMDLMTYLVIIILYFSFMIVFLDAPLPSKPHILVEAIFLMAMLGLGMGVCNAMIAHFFNSWKNLYGIMSMPLLLLSGIFYSLDEMPHAFASALAYNPMIHGVELFRTGYFNGYRSQQLDVEYLMWWALITLFVGFFFERLIRMRR